MQITRQSEYAIRILIELAMNEEKGMMRSSLIAERQEIPEKFLQKTIQIMVHSGYIESKRGTSGGVKLAKPSRSITIADVIETVEGGIAINQCLNGNFNCARKPSCQVRKIFRRAQDALRNELSKESLADLIGEGS
jgi:Rrf2 family protein